MDLGRRPAALADNWAGRLETERGFYAFNDMHAMMAFTLARHDIAERTVHKLASAWGWRLLARASARPEEV